MSTNIAKEVFTSLGFLDSSDTGDTSPQDNLPTERAILLQSMNLLSWACDEVKSQLMQDRLQLTSKFPSKFHRQAYLTAVYLTSDLSINDIATMIGLSDATVRRDLKGMGVDTSAKLADKRARAATRREEIKKEYLTMCALGVRGAATRVATKFGISRQRVNAIVSSNNS